MHDSASHDASIPFDLFNPNEFSNLLFKDALDALFVAQPNGRIIAVNDLGITLSGYSREELFKGTIADLGFSELPTQKQKIQGRWFAFPSSTFRPKNGSVYPVHGYVWGLANGGTVWRVCAVPEPTLSSNLENDPAGSSMADKYRIVADFTYDWETWLDTTGAFIYVSPACERITGYSANEFIQDATLFTKIVHEDERAMVERHFSETLEGLHTSTQLDFRIKARDGSEHWIEHICQPVFGSDGTWLGYRASNRESTDRKRNEEIVRRINRELRAISDCNQTLLRAVDEQTLLNDICKIICDEAGYRMAWVGFAEQDVGKTIRPVAWAGVESGYIANAKLTWSEAEERGRGPAGMVIRNGETVYVQDFSTDPRMTPWRENAFKRGYRSGIALPLKDEKGYVFGVLMIYSSEVAAITEPEIRLLGELAGDLAFGITAMRIREDRQCMERALQEKVKHSHALLRLSKALELAQTYTESLNKALEEVKQVLGYQSLWVYLLSEDKTHFKALTASGKMSETVMSEEWTATLPIKDDRYLEALAASMEPLVIEDARTDARLNQALVASLNMRTVVNLPVFVLDQKVGVVGTGSFGEEGVRVPTPSELAFLAALASHLAVSLDRIRLHQERRRAEEEVRASEAKYRTLFEESFDGLFITSPNGKILDMNKKGIAMFGYTSKEEILSLELERDVYVYPPDRKWILAMVNTRGTAEYEVSVKRKDGSKMITHCALSAVKDEQGTVVHYRGIIRDITEKKRAEEALLASEIKLRSIVDNIGIGVALISPRMEVLELNQQMKAWFPLVEPQRCPKCFQAFNLPPREGICEYCPTVKTLLDGLVHEALTQTPSGNRIRNFRVVSSPIRNTQGEVTAAIELVEDITEQRSLEAQLRQAQKMESIGRLAGGVAHDFNNKLTVILGELELAFMETSPTAPINGYLRAIEKAGQQSAELTRQLLAFARKQTIAPVVLDLNSAVTNMLNMLRRLIGEDIELTWVPASQACLVKMDPSQIDQILANLCVNARDAITGEGKVLIETELCQIEEEYCVNHPGFSPDRYVLLTVSDNGCGMDEETQGKIFEPFFTTKELGKGTGLGLATVYGIVKQNDGIINVYSEPGKGTTMKIYFHNHACVTEGVHVGSGTAETLLVKGKETVLLVEDEPGSLALCQKMLEKLGYQVLSADTPSKAIRLAENQNIKIDLLMTDVVMPEMNGPELVKRITPCSPHVKALFMSGYTANIIAHKGILDGNVHFIQKPFTLKDLAIRVREALED